MKVKELTVKDIKNIITDKVLTIVPVFMIIGIIIIRSSFLQIGVLIDILTQSAIKMTCTLGLMFALFLRGTDLSGGRQVGLAAVMVTSLSQMTDYLNRFWPGLPELPTVIPAIMTLALVTAIGVVNGFMITKLEVTSFIAILGMNTIIYDIDCLYPAKKPNNPQPVEGIRDDLTVFGSLRVSGQVSFLVVIAVVAVISAQLPLNKTVFRENIYIVGGNPEVAEVSGTGVSKVIIIVPIIESTFAGLVGIPEVARTGGANSAHGNVYESNAISSCVAGGVFLSGGAGKISGITIGVLVFTFISYGLVYIGANSNWQLIIKGFIIYSVVALDIRKNP